MSDTALAALGLSPDSDPAVAVDAPDGSLTLFCVEVPEPKVGKNRMHLDLTLDEQRLALLIALGATVIGHMPEWTVMADPEGNEFCVFAPDGTVTDR